MVIISTFFHLMFIILSVEKLGYFIALSCYHVINENSRTSLSTILCRLFPDEHRSDEQVNGEDPEAAETIPACDIIRVTGQPDKAEAAKQALLGLVPITIEVCSSNLRIFIVSIVEAKKLNKFFFSTTGRRAI